MWIKVSASECKPFVNNKKLEKQILRLTPYGENLLPKWGKVP